MQQGQGSVPKGDRALFEAGGSFRRPSLRGRADLAVSSSNKNCHSGCEGDVQIKGIAHTKPGRAKKSRLPAPAPIMQGQAYEQLFQPQYLSRLERQTADSVHEGGKLDE